MTKTDAVALLNLDADYSDADVVRRFQELYNEYQIRVANAPTPTLKKTYQKNLEDLLAASTLLAPDATRLLNLPGSEPVQRKIKTPNEPLVQPDPVTRKDEGLPRSTMVALAVAAVLAGLASFFGIVWFQQPKAQGGTTPTNGTPRLDTGAPSSSTDEVRKAAEVQRMQLEVERMRLELEKAKREDSRSVEEIERAKAEAVRRDEEARAAAARGAVAARIEDARRARAEQQEQWQATLVDGKGNPYPGVTVLVGAGVDKDMFVLRFVMSSKDLEHGAHFGSTVGFGNRNGEAVFRFPVLHVHARECRGYLYISPTRVVYDPVETPNFKNDAFDVPRDTLRRLGAKSNLFKIETPQRNYDFAFSARESGGKTTSWWGSPVRDWAERALLDYATARSQFERAVGDIVASAR